MSGIGRRYRLARAQKRFLPDPGIGGRGPLPWLALMAVIVIVVLVNGVDRGGGELETRRLDLVRAVMVDPIDMVVTAARTHRIVVLGDVLGAEAPKRFAADVIEALARGPGLDVVALEVDSELQSRIDSYLEAREEDTSLLLARPRVTREWEGVDRSFLEIYRRVRTINAEMGASRRIRIIALDAPGWPPSPPPSPARLAKRFGERGEYMARALDGGVLARNDRGRVLIIADGIHALRGRIRIETGGEVMDSVPLLAEWLDSRTSTGSFTVLVDAPVSAPPALGLGGYRPGRLFESLRPASPDAPFGFRMTPGLQIEVNDLSLWRAPGVGLEITATAESRLIDAWVRLPG